MNYLKSFKQVLNRVIPFVLFLAVLGFLITSVSAQATEPTEEPAVEWLKFQVPAPQQAQFIEQDAAIWTPVLASYPGFQSKEIWTNPDSPNELVIVTHWTSFDQWQAIPQEVLDRTTQRFHQAMGAEYTPESMGFRLAWHSN
ncbi:MAG TPA: TIGR03792 family protein, partial [Allocoleopsis sp.]